jgi:arginase
MRGIRLIGVPYHAGDDRHPASEGPRRLFEAGAAAVVCHTGSSVKLRVIDRGGAFRDTASSSAAVNKATAADVGAALAADELPIVIAGSCVSCQGVLGGFQHSDCGAVWIDAHADFNTPESSASGFFPGMSLAVITGHCFRDYWAQIGDNTPLKEDRIVVLGVRDVSPPAERERLEESAMRVVEWRDGKAQDDVAAALNTLAAAVDDIYLHIDFDAFAPDVAPGVADEPVVGGLSADDAEEIVDAVGARFRIKAATLATFTPAHDEENKTLALALRLLDLIGNCAGAA